VRNSRLAKRTKVCVAVGRRKGTAKTDSRRALSPQMLWTASLEKTPGSQASPRPKRLSAPSPSSMNGSERSQDSSGKQVWITHWHAAPDWP